MIGPKIILLLKNVLLKNINCSVIGLFCWALIRVYIFPSKYEF